MRFIRTILALENHAPFFKATAGMINAPRNLKGRTGGAVFQQKSVLDVSGIIIENLFNSPSKADDGFRCLVVTMDRNVCA